MSTSVQRIVVVGLGSIGRRHARLLAQRLGLAVEICEPNAQMSARAQQEMGRAVPVHTDFPRMLQTKPDAVLIATPHSLHAEQAIAAMEAGAHVLCEKPMADSVASAQAMAAASQRTKKILAIGFMYHHHPMLRRVRELIQTGVLGQLLHLHYRVGSYITLVNSISRYQKDLPGALFMDYAHQPDLFHWWLGKSPRGAYVAATQAGDFEFTSNPNIITLTLDYDSPLLVTLHLNYAQMPQRGECEIVGDRGWLVADTEENVIRIGMRATQTITRESFTVVRDDMYITEHQTFLDAVAGRCPPDTAPQDALVSVRTVALALRAWQEKRRVEAREIET